MGGRLQGLDALRGIAALLVLWLHLRFEFPVWLYPPRGHLAVDFFFMLSGYVMARTYEGSMAGGAWFMRKRIRRLWPTVAIGSALGLGVLWSNFPADFALIAAFNLLLLPSLWTVAAFPLNTPMWSIFFELIANALHGFGLHRVGTRQLARLAAVAGVATLWLAIRAGNYGLGSQVGDFLGGFPRVVFGYFFGVILWRVWRDRPPVRFGPLWLLPFGLFLFTPREPLTDFLFVALACPAIMAIGLNWSPGRWASYAGGLSFPLYAVHRPVIALTAAAGVGWFAGVGASLAVAALLTALLPSGSLRRPASAAA